MGKHLRAVLVGGAVFTVLLIGFGMYSWTAIHSGWSAFGRTVFGIAVWIAPILGGILAGWWAYRGPTPIGALPPRTAWVTAVSVAMMVATGTAVALEFVGAIWSYAVWAAAGRMGGAFLMASPIIGLALITLEKRRDRARDVRWPLALIGFTGFCLIAELAGGYLSVL